MSFTALDERPDTDTTDADDESDHIFCCCSPNIAMCGKDITDQEAEPFWSDDIDDAELCEQCWEISEHPCVLCGHSGDGVDCHCGRCWAYSLPESQQRVMSRMWPDGPPSWAKGLFL